MSTSGLTQAAKDAANRPLRVKFARMQYRQNSDGKDCSGSYRADSKEPWIGVDSSYEVKGIAEGNPEPPNVQQVTLTSKGLEVKQYGNEYNAQYNTKGIKDVECAVYGWQVTFARTNMRYLHLQEYDVKYWVEGAPEDATRPFCVIRFLYVGPVVSADVSELPADNTSMAVETSGFPLAKLCSDNEALKGKEIRLAFLKPSSILKCMHSWQWPKAIHTLSNSFDYDTVDDALSRGPLNPWAESNKDRLAKVTLSKAEVEGKVEWRMHKKEKKQPPPHSKTETSKGPAERPREEDDEEAFDAETDRLEREWRKAVASSEEAHEMVKAAQRELSKRIKAEKAAQSAFIVRRKQREDRFGQDGRK